jgi:hypothetical protein
MRIKFFSILILPLSLNAQLFKSPEFGWNTVISLQFGTHINSIGIQVNSYFTDRNYQLNFGEQLSFRISDLGQRMHFFQSRMSTGLVLLTGKQSTQRDFQLNGLYQNTKRNYGIAYNYIWYEDNKGSTQLSGGWGLHLKKISILVENDIFGGQGKDRFRTGSFDVSYRDSIWKFHAGFSIWTGETQHTDWQKITFSGCPNGYRSLEDTHFGKTSHGIGYVGLDYAFWSYQWLACKVGIDSERLRHQLQNRMLHDLIWLPKYLPRKTPHYPMLDENGCPVFEKWDARESNLFLEGGINTNWSY